MRLPAVLLATVALLLVGAPADAGGPTLATLPVRAEVSGADYDREAFGQRWKDIDRNGCGQRNDALKRDLRQVVLSGKCVVVSGTLIDPYTGQTVQFTRAKAGVVEIDHIVSLAEAWRSGAKTWTPAKRETFANDLTVLAATAGAVNRRKSDKDASTWDPIGSARRCWYARKVVAIKGKYGLSVDRREKSALAADLRGCR